MTKTEIYEYAMYFSLAKDQHKALDKQDQGKLGWFGRTRLPSRLEAIEKTVNKIIKYKLNRLESVPADFAKRCDAILSTILDDLEHIGNDTKAWDDVNEDEAIEAMQVFQKQIGYFIADAINRLGRGAEEV